MNRVLPNKNLINTPCSIVAVACVLGRVPEDIPDLKNNGYASLTSANKFFRSHLKIKKRIDYKKNERPKLKDLHMSEKAIICVYGHFLYLEGEMYYSFYDNENDKVVAVWIIE